MGARAYAYQYETSPRKLRPEEEPPNKKPPKKVNKKPKVNSKKKQDKIKAKEARMAKINFTIVMVVALGCILFIMYRNVKINESFSEVQTLSKTVSSIEKENSQIAVNIQNNLNLGNIESMAAATLGMQKLSSKQTIYINLDTKDYVEISNKKIEKENKPGFFKSIINKISEFF